MENFIYNFIIFIIVLFIYLHINFHYKVNNDLEIFNIENPSKDEFEELCDQRQGLVFKYKNKINNYLDLDYLSKNYSTFEINLKNMKDKEQNIYFPLDLKKSIELFKKDKDGKYISEQNSEFLKDTGLNKLIREDENLLKPALNADTNYDILFGSNNSYTELRYDISYRNFFNVLDGSVIIKLTVPKNKKYLDIQKDYDNFIFYSNIDMWNIQEEYKSNVEKIKTIEITLHKNDSIYIPAYWFYSIKFKESSVLLNYKFKPYMNILAILPEYLLNYLQKTNIKIKHLEPIDKI